MHSTMTLSVLLLLAMMAPAASAFAVVNPQQQTARPFVRLEMANTNDDAGVRRRHVLQQSAALLLLVTTTATPAFAERPTYLTEPTDEFKESERQRAEFRKAQLLIKQKFVVVLDRLSGESKTADQLEADLQELRSLVTATGGLPLGIKKDDIVKQVRAKKAKGFWPTKVEYAYQGLINEIAFQQSPNREKDIGNPL